MSIFVRLAGATAWVAAHPLRAALLIATALAVIALVVRNVGDPASEGRRRTATIVLFLLAGLVLAVGGSLFLVQRGRWGYLLALLPGATIARHAIYMRLIRRRAMAAPVAPPPGLRRSPPADGRGDDDPPELKDPGLSLVFARARQMHDLDFAPDTLAVRFGVPALLTAAIGIGVFEVLGIAPSPLTPLVTPEIVHAARFGAAGALVYVLLYLGQRGFRSDITTGAALWSAIVLAVGPLFGAVLSLMWKGDEGTAPWTRDALYFVAGMSPRYTASAVEEAVRRLWLSRTPSQVQPRLQPLALLRGITPSIEDRLAEEGITDVQGMAMADPLKLFRSTSFDKRQILGWMDEAMLISWLPEYWTALQKVGLTGAIDLMAHVQHRLDAVRAVLASTAKLEPAQVDAVVLAGTVLKEDAQLRLVWALYQFDEDGFEAPATTEADAAADGLGPNGAAPASLPIPALGWLLGALALGLGAAAWDATQVSVRDVVPVVAVLAIAFAIALTVGWPWRAGGARYAPVAGVVLLFGIAGIAHKALSPMLAWQWPVQEMLLAAAALCGGVFLVGLIASAAGRTLTVEFPHGAPPDAELWVDGRAVSIAGPAAAGTTCTVAGRRVAVVVRSGGAEHRRWLDARGQRSPRLSVSLPATVVLQLDPPTAGPVVCRVDGAETDRGAITLWPRALPYGITVEAKDFLPAAESITVATAGVIGLPVRLRQLPPKVLVGAGVVTVAAPSPAETSASQPEPVPPQTPPE